MYTLITLLAISYIYVCIRLYRIAQEEKGPFNPINGNLFEFAVFIIGTSFFVILIFNFIINYLP